MTNVFEVHIRQTHNLAFMLLLIIWHTVGNLSHFCPGLGVFELEHSVRGACGIPDIDGDSIIMTGGFEHSFVTRSFPPWSLTFRNLYLGMIVDSKSRYNINGFVEELPQLPEVRQSHACAALPTTRVSQEDNSCCTLFLNRHLLLLEAKIQRATNLLWWFYPLEQVPGHSLPLCPGLWRLLQLLLLEEDSVWLVVVMELPTNLRWPCFLFIRQKQKINCNYQLSILKKL